MGYVMGGILSSCPWRPDEGDSSAPRTLSKIINGGLLPRNENDDEEKTDQRCVCNKFSAVTIWM
jgi:hypothetical protein